MRHLPPALSLLLAGAVATVATGLSAQTRSAVQIEQVSIKADDGEVTEGMLYSIPSMQPKTVVVTMHPNDDRQRHYMLRPAAERGFAGFGMKSRWWGQHGIHEELLLDIAAAVRYLKKERGFERVVFTGQSGGGSLFAFYQSQAETQPPNRLKETPAGDPPDLNKVEMIPGDGIVILNANEGEALHLTHHLDPSIVDETDPFSVDPSLDMYSPANGFKMPPESSVYSPEFRKKFRDAQWARAERLTAMARGYIRERDFYRELKNAPGFDKLPLERRLEIERRAEHLPMMVVYRSEADLDYTDQITRRSDREYGSNRSRRPDVFNLMPDARMRTIRPDVFLSTMSGPASRARLHENIRKVTVPTLVLIGTADRGTYTWEQEQTYENAGAKDKTVVKIEGADHAWHPSGPKAGDGKQMERMLDALFTWAGKRFPRGASAGTQTAR
jgi:pimeloyl-ACP methyl ester carboxylesterase